MAGHAPAWRHPRWEYDQESSDAARRSAARMAARRGERRPQTTYPDSRPHAPHTRPRVVSRPAPRARLSTCLRVAALIVLAGVMVAVPVRLNTAAVQAEVQLAELEQHEADLMAERSALQAQAAALSSLDRVEQLAQQLGMVNAVEFEFLDLGATSAGAQVAEEASGDQQRRR